MKGIDVVQDPLWNKGSGYSIPERERLRIRGLLPHKVLTIEQQKANFLERMRKQDDPVEKGLVLALGPVPGLSSGELSTPCPTRHSVSRARNR